MLILIAPPQTIHETEQIWTGNTDTTLSEVGLTVARSLAWYDSVDVDRAFVAPAEHFQEFAKIILTRLEWETIPELTDRSMGTLTGRVYRATMAEFPRRNWLAWHRSYWTAPPEGQSFFDISDRVLTFFRTKILPIAAHDRVAIIAAPDVLRIIIGHCSKTEEAEVPKIRIEPCIPHVVNGDL